MKSIVMTPNNVLVTKTEDVKNFNNEVKQLISDLRSTLAAADNPKGVGLAATQIGIGLRVFAMRPEETDPIRIFINPKITKKSKKILKGIPGDDGGRLEGCLSIPGVWGIVKRHEEIEVSYLDENGKQFKESFSGFPAIIIQHEIDHLEGVLFPKRVLEQKGDLYQTSIDKEGKEVLEPLEL